MSEFVFLSVEEVEMLHQWSLGRFGGQDGIRDRNAFESAVYHPQNIYFYDQGDVFDIAAAYCYHIAQAQAFLDGNKRTAAAAAIVFLEANGYPLKGDPMRIYEAMIRVANHESEKTELRELFRELTANPRLV